MKKLHKKLLISFFVLGTLFFFSFLFYVNQVEISPYMKIDYYFRWLSLNFNYLKYSIEYSNYTNPLITEESYPVLDSNDIIIYAKSVPVLIYHGVLSEQKFDENGYIQNDGFNLPVENFKDQMFALKKAGWQTITMADFEAFMRGEKKLPDKSFLLTFDDGRKDSYYGADPILKAVDYNAVMFVITGESLNPDKKAYKFHLNIGELQDMVDNRRWELEAHTAFGHGAPIISEDGAKGHFYSDKLWLPEQNRIETEEEFSNRVYDDMKLAKDSLKETFGVNSTTIAYPFGDYGKDTINFPGSKNIIFSVVHSLFDYGFYQTWVGDGYTYNYPNEKETALIKRLEPDTTWTGEQLINYLEFGKAREIPYDSNTETGFNGFVDNEGTLLDTNGALTLSTNKNKTSAFAFLDGTYLWENYTYNMKVQKYSAQTFSLMARVASPADYVSCTYSKELLQIIKSVNNEATKIAEKKIKYLELPSEILEVGIKVEDNNVSCMIKGEVILEGEINSEELKSGGIGFGIWNPSSNASLTTDRITAYFEEVKKK